LAVQVSLLGALFVSVAQLIMRPLCR